MNMTRLTWTAALLFLCLQFATAEPVTPTSAAADETAGITRTIDASKYFRPFPDLVGYRNTSIQKAPAPVLAEVSERELGKAKVTRCWLNLDEMWDYRTRKYDDNYQIGVHKYDDIPEKFRESWDWVTATNVHFHDYLKAFGKHSNEVLLCIRRYERDILDGKLGVTMDDWKTIFKHAVKQSKQACPNVRYIEVCNEYGCSGFIGCTPDEYYRFYQLAYQAVGEVNAELGLEGKDRLLVGGPNAVRDAMNALNRFFENFSQDRSPHKRLDFVTWHEYHNRYADTAQRQEQVSQMLALNSLPTNLPMFITEHDPYHLKAGMTEYNLINGAALVKSLYFTSLYSPNVKIMPWVLYHDGKIQTRFMWFEGPNEPDTKADELRMLPSGCSMKLLSKHKRWEIAVDNSIPADQIVLASVSKDGLAVQAVNYGDPKDVSLRIEKLPEVFTSLAGGELKLVKYLIDEKHSNCVANPDYPGGLQKLEEGTLKPHDGTVTLTHPGLAKHGIVFWQLIPTAPGKELNSPVSLAPPVTTPKQPTFDPAKAFDTAVATPNATIQRNGSTVLVRVKKSKSRPGVNFQPPTGGWDMTGLGFVEAKVKNVGQRPLNVHLVLDNPDANRTERKGCVIHSTTIAPGKDQVLKVAISNLPPESLKMAFRGMRGTPGGGGSRQGSLDPTNVVSISVYVYHPGADYEYEVSDLRCGGNTAFPLPEKLTDFFPMIDRFGQYIHKDWPGKTHSEKDLIEEREKEAKDLAAHPGPKGWNQYGGWLGGPQLEATGRFRVAKWNDKWWLVDPDGRLFWSHGLVRVTWSSGYTPITGRRFLFADIAAHRLALRPVLRAQHLGHPRTLRAGCRDLQLHRRQPPPQVRSPLGRRCSPTSPTSAFAVGDSTQWPTAPNLPSTSNARLLTRPPSTVSTRRPKIRPVERATWPPSTTIAASSKLPAAAGDPFPDVFDPSFKATLLKEVAQHKGKAVGDPWCLGYFLGNELTWGHDDTWLAAAVLKSPASQAAKRVLLDGLKKKYENIDALNAAWATNHASWGRPAEIDNTTRCQTSGSRPGRLPRQDGRRLLPPMPRGRQGNRSRRALSGMPLRRLGQRTHLPGRRPATATSSASTAMPKAWQTSVSPATWISPWSSANSISAHSTGASSTPASVQLRTNSRELMLMKSMSAVHSKTH